MHVPKVFATNGMIRVKLCHVALFYEKKCRTVKQKWTLLFDVKKMPVSHGTLIIYIMYMYTLIIGNTSCKNIQTYKPLPVSGIEPGTSRIQSGGVTSALTSQLRVTIAVKLFNCFDAMGRNVNIQSRICGPHIFNKFLFSDKNAYSGPQNMLRHIKSST